MQTNVGGLSQRLFAISAGIFFSVLLLTQAAVASPSFTTQMFDNSRSGWNPNETQLTVANVQSSFRFLFQQSLDGQVYAQPLYLPGLNMGAAGVHNVVFVATEHNTIYAFDADASGPALWSQNLTPTGGPVQVATDYQNTRVPQIGSTSTPVIDTSTNTIYLVAASKSI